MAFSDYFGGGGGFTLDPTTQMQIEDVNKPLPQQSTGGKVSAWLANPENRLMLLQMGKALSPMGISGGKEDPTVGARISDAFAPGVKGEIAQQKTNSVEGAVVKGIQKPNANMIPGKASSALGDHSYDLSSPDVTGLTHTIKPDGTVSYSVKSPGPKDYSSAKIIADQQASGAVPASQTPQAQPATKISEALGNQSPFVASQDANAGSSGGGNIPAADRQNNLGNIRSGPGSFRAYVSPTEGAADAVQLLRKGYTGLTLAQIGNKWAPPSENNTAAWVSNVARASGLDPNGVPNMEDPETLKRLLKGIATAEHSSQNLMRFSDDVIDGGVKIGMAGTPINWQTGAPSGGSARPTILAQAQPNYGTVSDAPVSYAPPERFSSYLGNSPTVRGLDPNEVTQATELGMKAAKLPYDISHTAAGTKLIDAQADVARQGLVTNKPIQLTLPGGQKLTTTGKDYLDYVQKVDHNALLKQHYESQLAQAQDLSEIRKSTAALREAQQEEVRLKAQARKSRMDLIEKMGDKKVPGSDLTFREADALGVLDDYLRQDQATQSALDKQNLALANDVRKRHAKLKAEFSNPLANSDFKTEAKARKISMDQLFELKMAEEYPNWKRYMSPQQGESVRVGSDPLGLRK